MKPLRRRTTVLLPTCLAVALLIAGGLLAPAPALAGSDDFQFGQALANQGKKTGQKFFFAAARKVYEKLLANPRATEDAKDLARFGLAELNSQRALGAMARPTVMYGEVVGLLREATDALEAFAKKYPSHERANEAKLLVGTTRLGFVQWARDQLLPDADMMQERGADANEVQRDAKAFVTAAIEHFDGLRGGHDKQGASDLSQLAQYHWVLCQHYRALVLDPCSEEAMAAFKQAGDQLEDFATSYDGKLVAVYAQDILGLNFVEMAKCAGSEADQADYVRNGLMWFETCMDTPNEGPDFLRVITSGYYHYARTCLQSGRIGDADFYRLGVDRVSPMLASLPDAWRQDNGIKALIELGKLQRRLDRIDEAVESLKTAAEYAKRAGKGYLEQLANRELETTLSSGGNVKADPEVVKRVADALYAQQKWPEAIAAYQKVIASMPRTEENMKAYLTDCWLRISRALKSQGDLLGAALALEPLHEAWIDGVMTKVGGAEDPNMQELGRHRYTGLRLWRELAEQTESRAYDQRAQEIQSSFNRDYPEHPIGEATTWNEAHKQFRLAVNLKGENKAGWRKALDIARQNFELVSKDAKAERQDHALVYLARCEDVADEPAKVVERAKAAIAFWDSPAEKERAKEFPTIRQRRFQARGQLGYYLSKAYVELEQWDDVIQSLEGWHADYDGFKDSERNRIMYSGNLGHLVLAYLNKGDIETTDRYLNRLLKVDPGYYRLPSITQQLASFYNDQAKDIEKRLLELGDEIQTLKPELVGDSRELHTVIERRVDLANEREVLNEQITIYEEAVAAGEDPGAKGVQPGDYEKAKKRVPEIEQELKELGNRYNAARTQVDAKETRQTEILKEVDVKKGELYPPRVRAAGYFYGLYKALKESSPDKIIPENVKIYGDLYRRAAALRPGIRENWDRARELYEDYLDFKGIPEDDRQEAVGQLGSIYYRLAKTAEDEEKRAAYVREARNRLQGSIARVPENNPLLVGLLKGDYAVVSWDNTLDDRTYRFVFERYENVAELERAVNNMGASGGPPVPRYETEAENRRFAEAIRSFKTYYDNELSANERKRLVASIKRGGFDAPLYMLHGNAKRSFRLALAWVYAESGDPEDAPKALNLANTLTRSTRFGFEENSEDWWLARVTGIRARVLWASSMLKTAGQTAETKNLVELASRDLAGLVTQFPQLGAPDRPESLDELRVLFDEIQAMRLRTGLEALTVMLRRSDPLNPGGADAPADGQPKSNGQSDGEPK